LDIVLIIEMRRKFKGEAITKIKATWDFVFYIELSIKLQHSFVEFDFIFSMSG